jgi:hypothetical protein
MAEPEPADDPVGRQVLASYFEANGLQQGKLRDMSMEMEIDASLPGMKKSGKGRVSRVISKVGQITYGALEFVGDNTIKKDVIARYMGAEQEAATKPSLSINEQNYKFKYYGLHGDDPNWKLHLFYITPKKKEPGLFKGWLWVEANTALPVREQGEFVKNPSVWLRKVEFIRDYVIRDGVAFPTRIHSLVETRLFGKAEMDVRYVNYQPNESGPRERAANNLTTAQASQ